MSVQSENESDSIGIQVNPGRQKAALGRQTADFGLFNPMEL